MIGEPTNALKKLQVLSIKRQSFDDSHKQIDDANTYLRHNSLLTINDDTIPIEEYEEENDEDFRPELTGWNFSKNIADTKDNIKNVEKELKDFKEWKISEQENLEAQIQENRKAMLEKFEARKLRDEQMYESEDNRFHDQMTNNTNQIIEGKIFQ